MVTFVAKVAVDMDTLYPDLGVLVDASAVWFNAGPIFTATSSDGFLKVAGMGGPFTNTGGKPGTGAIDSLTVIYGSIVPTIQYSITGLGATFDGLQTKLNAIGSYDTFYEMFGHNDKITGSDDDDHLFELIGNDTIHGRDGKDVIDGQQDSDYLYGDDGDDHLNGGADNDVLIGGAGKDTLDGGTGNDTAMYDSLYTRVVVKLAGAAAANVVIDGHLEDTVVNVENIYGGHAGDALTGDGHANVLFGYGGNDKLNGAGGADILNGGDGKDVLSGGAAADLLDGGKGNDTLVGGKGHDTFIFDSALKKNVDIIKDFSVGDEIRLSHHIFSAIAVGSHHFFAVGAAHHAGDHIIYHADTGDLFYDADGNGAGGAVRFAHLANHHALTDAYFLVTA